MMDFDDKVTRFIESALPEANDHRAGGTNRADALLEADPEIARSTIHVAAMPSDVDRVRKLPQRDPAAATAKSGPRNCNPLLYLSSSRYLRVDAERAGRMVEVAGLLLEAGADPNTHWTDPDAREGVRQSALCGAAGVASNVPLARLLLRAAAYGGHLELVEMLLARGHRGHGQQRGQDGP